MRRLWGYTGFVLLLTATVLLAVSKFLPRLNGPDWGDSFTTTGQVTGFLQNGTERIPLVSFVAADGLPYLFEARNTVSMMQQGQTVTIRYSLSPNLQAALIQDCSTAQLICAIAGCLLAASGLTLLILQLRQSTLRRQLTLYGVQTPAVITGMHVCRYIHIFGRRLYVFALTARSPQGIGEISIKGKNLLKSSTRLTIGNTIPVLMDTSNPWQYIILWEDACPAGSSADTAP